MEICLIYVELVAEAVIKIIKKPIRIPSNFTHYRAGTELSLTQRFLHKTLIDGFI